VRAVAKALFSDKDFELATAVFNITKSRAEKRNKLAHSLWGYSDDIPDGLIAVEASYYTIKNFKNAVGDEIVARFDKQKYHEMWVYKEQDLRDLIDQINGLYSYIIMLDSLNTTDAAERTKVWDQFRKFPEIVAALPKP
jgi:hypothetical protein